MQIDLKPGRVATVLGTIAGSLVLAGVLGLISKYGFGHDQVYGLVPYFYLEGEQTLPAFYSTLALVVASLILVSIAATMRRVRDRFTYYWYGLSAVFLFLAVDEATALHERLTPRVQGALDTSGATFATWVLPYAVLVLVIGLIYIRFLLALPRRTAILMVVSGAVFIGGAVGLEVIYNAIYYTPGLAESGNWDLTFDILIVIEESMEMGGVIMFIYTLLDYAESTMGGFYVASRRDPDTAD